MSSPSSVVSLSDDEGLTTQLTCPPNIEQTTSPALPSSQSFAIWSAEHEASFSLWWKQTQWRREHRKVSILWDTSLARAKAWTNFRTIASVKNGRPFVQCLRCHLTLRHPSIEHSGTSTLARHPTSKQCRKSAKRKGLAPIQRFVQPMNVR
jgi:hypothetical protein